MKYNSPDADRLTHVLKAATTMDGHAAALFLSSHRRLILQIISTGPIDGRLDYRGFLETLR